jgi:hypothetical protein
VIDDVNVIPMTSPEVLHGQTVVVRDGRIVAIGSWAPTAISPDAIRINGNGKYLIPGLVDAHVHFQERDDENRAFLRLFVANGVTTVVNLFGTPTHLRLRADVAGGALLGPRIFTSGPSVGTPHGQPPTTTSEDVAQAVRTQKRAGYDFVKLHGDLTDAAYHTLLRTARQERLRVVGHAPRNLGVDVMLRERQPAVAHVEEYLYAALFYRRPQHHPLPGADATIRKLAVDTARAGTSVISTLEVYRGIADQIVGLDRVLARPEVKCVPQPLSERLGWWPPHNTYVQRFGTDAIPVFHGNYDLLARLTLAFQRSGVPVLAGTDAPTPAVVPGFSLHDELRDLVRAGFTPYEALKTATVNPARFIGYARDGGTLDAGARADAVLLDANPLEDISHTASITGVLVNGRWISRADIERLLQETGAGCHAAESPSVPRPSR